eukprot:g5387.t1
MKNFLIYKGLLFMIFSAMSFSVMTFCVSITGRNYALPVGELIVVRALIGMFIILPILKRNHPKGLVIGALALDQPKKTRILIASRGVIGLLGMYANWTTLSNLELGDATGVIFFGPPLTMLLASVMLNEPCNIIDAIAIIVSAIGVILFARPPAIFSLFGIDVSTESSHTGNEESLPRLVAVSIGVVGAFFSALTNIVVRKLKEVDSLVVVFQLYCAVVIFGFLKWLYEVGKVSQHIYTSNFPFSIYIAILSIGVFGLLGQFFKTEGLKLEKAGPAAMMRNLDLVFAFLLQAFVLGEKVHSTSLVAALLTLSSSFVLGWQAIQRTRTMENEFDSKETKNDFKHQELPQVEEVADEVVNGMKSDDLYYESDEEGLFQSQFPPGCDAPPEYFRNGFLEREVLAMKHSAEKKESIIELLEMGKI